MKHPTNHLKKLRRSIQHARTIVSRVNPHESQTPLQHLKVQSFILLTHAAIEEYLENLGREVAREARQKFKKEGRITRSLIALVAAKALNGISEKNRLQIKKDIVSNIDIFSEEAANAYEQSIKINHGIRIGNQQNILYPIGVDPGIDVFLMNTLDAYGGTRGDLAHTFAIKTIHTLSDINLTLKWILDGLIIYDKAACEALMVGMEKSRAYSS